MTHELKIAHNFADAVLSGEKPFEVRKNDRGYQKGDYIVFTVIEGFISTAKKVKHDLNGKRYRITYVLSGWGIEDGFVVLGIEPEVF